MIPAPRTAAWRIWCGEVIGERGEVEDIAMVRKPENRGCVRQDTDVTVVRFLTMRHEAIFVYPEKRYSSDVKNEKRA
jgi:hypothetical protein